MRIPLYSSIFLIPFLLILFGVDILSVSGKCRYEQRSLLIQLRNNLQFKNSSKLVLWNQTTDCCSWEGVKCDNSSRVTDLDLSSKSISGGINGSSTLFSLRFLRSVNLAYNVFNFTQKIPPEFKNLTSLTNLNLSNSGFGGQIPIELSQLTRLVTLDLSTLFPGNFSLKLENPNLTMFVQNLKELTELYLDGVKISAQGYDWGQAISSSLPNLRVLSLTNCNLSGPIDSSLAKLQFLSVIRLDQNNLATPVPEFIADFKNLTALRLSYCNLTRVFPQKIFGLHTLKNLDLSNNGLLHGSLSDFPENGSLQSLGLTNTNFSGALPVSIGNLGMLSKLDLAKANFTGQIPSSVGKLTQLAYLDFSSNKFNGTMPLLRLSKNLTHVDFSRNNMSGPLSSTQFDGLVNLVSIDLRFNSFTGRIPSSLFGLPSLQQFQLSNNHFDGPLSEIPNASSSMLDTLDLSSNKLEGSIPLSFFDLKQLSVISLSYNNLNGSIQLENFQKLANLTTLDLSYNNLSIETSGNNSSLYAFPQISTLKLASCKLQNFPDLKNQSRLYYLDLSDNQIDGEIPNRVWSASLTHLNLSHNLLVNLQEPYVIPGSLSVLDLHSNHLRGELIPPQTATYVDYSSNYFSSSIPTGIGNNLTFAYFFSIANNNVTGTIPESICNAGYLQVLDMSNNSLSGAIPLCLIKRSETLGVLNLGKNHLSGNISGIFQGNCGLETLDLHDNHLEGKIPESLANCTSLEVLNLGNNRINDFFPCFLINSTNLRVLVLRSNMFHGSIQCPGVNESWPNLQIIDIASNNFSGALKPICFLKWEAMRDDPSDPRPEVKHLNFKVLQLNNFYYRDTVTVTNKGLEMELVKILTVFTAIDFSMNHFEGDIPETIGELKSLYVLNLSHNALVGSIPSTLGNLKQLGSLDLSVNKLSGEIPSTLSTLTFLGFLNLSHNQLTGKIPTSTQFQTFDATSFEGNKGLCGSPLSVNCNGSKNQPIPAPKSQRKSPQFDWQFIFTGLGFGFGAGLVLAPLMFWKQGRHWWDEQTDRVVIMILPTFGLIYTRCDDVKVEAEENIEEEDRKDAREFDDDEDEFEDKAIQGRYCVFCSKLDIFRKKAIHNPKCSCHSSTPIVSYFSSTSSSYSS